MSIALIIIFSLQSCLDLYSQIMKTYQIVALFTSGTISGVVFKLLCGHHDRKGDAQTRIIGGSKANTSEYPYAVSLLSSYFEDALSPSGHFCGGSFINPDVVLSAA
jgi:secreted trypsin-like serine protease